MGYFDPPPLSKVLWIWLREWQHEKGMSDENLAAALKLKIDTVESYDISAHSLTVEKIDNLIATVGIEPLVYVVIKYIKCVECLAELSIKSLQWEQRSPQELRWYNNF